MTTFEPRSLTLTEHLEQQLGAGLRERHMPESMIIHHQHLTPLPSLLPIRPELRKISRVKGVDFIAGLHFASNSGVAGMFLWLDRPEPDACISIHRT